MAVSKKLFTKEEFDQLCEYSRLGNLSELQKRLSSPLKGTSNHHLPLCPDPRLHLPSPLVLAAQYGHLIIVSHLLEKYGYIVDIDQGATIISRTTKKKVHHATALWAACTGGHLEIVKFLISRGADVNKTTLTRSTPLRGASFHGFISIMDYLLKQGADIDTPNCIGQSPLSIAAMRGEVEAVKYLLTHGANRDQCTINGYTVMHLAAAKGKNDVQEILLDHNVSPQFQEANPYKEGYVPCPLFLAASTGQSKAVQVLLDHKDCPLSCKSDAYLLLAAMQCEFRKRLRVNEPKILEYWEEGLRIRQENNLSVVSLPKITEYRYKEEIKTVDELASQWFAADFSRLDVFYQSLLIRERCMGFLDQGLIYFLIRRGSYFCHDCRFKEAELLWKRAMRMEIEVCEVEIRHKVYGHCEGIMRDLEKDLGVYSQGLRTMLEGGYIPDFPLYVKYGLQELDILSQLKGKADSEIVSCEALLGLVMEILISWIIHCNEESQTGSMYTYSPECRKLGELFVSQYLFYKPGTTLLHFALTNFIVSDSDEKRVLDHYTDLRPLITALLTWGADVVLNQPDKNGKRPIHIAIQLMDDNDDHEILSPLIEAGAHLDAVDGEGNTLYDLCTEEIHKVILYSCGPPCLTCFAARTIVSEKLNYHSLPRHVVHFIKIHDKDFVHTMSCNNKIT